MNRCWRFRNGGYGLDTYVNFLGYEFYSIEFIESFLVGNTFCFIEKGFHLFKIQSFYQISRYTICIYTFLFFIFSYSFRFLPSFYFISDMLPFQFTVYLCCALCTNPKNKKTNWKGFFYCIVLFVMLFV